MLDERKVRHLQQLGKKESTFLRLRRTRLGLDDFRTVKVIGKGAFGEVSSSFVFYNPPPHSDSVCNVGSSRSKTRYRQDLRDEDSQERRDAEERPGTCHPRVAVSHYLSQRITAQLAHVRAERDVLAESNSPWVVQLYYSFQDAQTLYLIMEFLPGGDLMTMLIKYDTFSEDVTRFYMAQCTLAIEAVHKLGFIHRWKSSPELIHSVTNTLQRHQARQYTDR